MGAKNREGNEDRAKDYPVCVNLQGFSRQNIISYAIPWRLIDIKKRMSLILRAQYASMKKINPLIREGGSLFMRILNGVISS